jgi:hypothetical protein
MLLERFNVNVEAAILKLGRKVPIYSYTLFVDFLKFLGTKR